MKLSAVLAISVPIAAASQLPAVAADAPPPVGGGTQWQNSVTPMRAQMSTTSYSAAQKQVPVAAHVAHASPTSAGLKLRPFKPGRYLPSERDLRAAAQAQQPQYDYSVDQQTAYAPGGGAMLSGQVSSQYSAPRARSVYDQYAMNPAQLAAAAMPIAQRVKAQVKRAIGQRAPQMVPNKLPVMPAQLSEQMVQTAGPEPMRQTRPVSMPCGPMPMQMAQNSMQMQQQQMMQQFQQMQMQHPMQMGMPMQPMMQQPMQQMQMPMQMQGQIPMQMQGQIPMQQQMQMPMQQMQSQNFAPADISPAEANAMFRQVVANPPQAKLGINGEMIGQALDNPGNGAGQPPFPLNFLGGNAMGQLSQSHYRPQNVPQARFGSWHGGSGLASAGFHSYVHRRKPMMYEYTRAPMPVKRATGKVASSGASAKRAMSAPPTVARTNAGPKPVKIATYGGGYRSTY